MQTATAPARPNPWLAAVLSLAATGVGQLYCGRTWRGSVLFASWLVLLPAQALAARLEPSTTALTTLLVLPALFLAGLWIWGGVDAWRLARRSPARPAPSPLATALLLLVGCAYPFAAVDTARSLGFQAYLMAGDSMHPTLREGDRILANGAVDYSRRDPQRFEVVVFESPTDARRSWVKRVVGLPGETVELRDGALLVDGVEQRTPFLHAHEGAQMAPRRVPPDTVFVLGDSLGRSRDSRHFGSVSREALRGAVQYVLLPRGGWTRFGHL